MRVGTGCDVHPLVKGRALIIGGVEIPYDHGLLGHSDGDVLSHAVGDAILGALAKGDLGSHFPDTDPEYEGISSLKLLERISSLLEGRRILNIDATVVCQEPRLAPHIGEMRDNLSRALGVDRDTISIKATTTERLGFTGRREGIACLAAVLVE